MEIGRLLTAMVTPFDGEGQVNYDQAKAWRWRCSRLAATVSLSPARPASRPP